MKISFVTLVLVFGSLAGETLATPVPPKPAAVAAAPKKVAAVAPKKALKLNLNPVTWTANTVVPPKKAVAKKKVARATNATLPAVSNGRRSTDRRDKLERRTVATTQFHATCSKTAASIIAEVKAHKLAPFPTRRWPDEFTWAGGLYLTPIKEKAELYGAYFLNCQRPVDRGTKVLLEFTLSTTGLDIKDVGSGAAAQLYHNEMTVIGAVMEATISPSGHGTTPPTFAKVQAAGLLDPGTYTSAIQQIIPHLPGITAGLTDASCIATLQESEPLDIITGTVPLNAGQQQGADHFLAAVTGAGDSIPAFTPPFTQVVLLTPKAHKAITKVEEVAVDAEFAQFFF